MLQVISEIIFPGNHLTGAKPGLHLTDASNDKQVTTQKPTQQNEQIQETTNSLFTPLTRTRQDCLVLSVSAVWTQLQTRQDSFVLSQPTFQFPSFQQSSVYLRLNSCKLESGSRRDKTVLSCRQLRSHQRHGEDKTGQFCLIRVSGVNKL